jgi:hypothetical protein
MPFSAVSSRSAIDVSWRGLADHSRIYRKRTLLARLLRAHQWRSPAKAGAHA